MPGFGSLVLLRHGQSTLNAAGCFTGLLDPPLTATGRSEAVLAAGMIASAGLVPSMIFSSTLARATQTALLLAQRLEFRGQPEQLWELNERNYGSLTGRSREELCTEYGVEVLHSWRRTLDGTPPPMDDAALDRLRISPALAGVPSDAFHASESLAAVSQRVTAVWLDHLRPRLQHGETLICVAHGNSLRALCYLLDRLSPAEVEELNIPTGQPLLYRFDGWGTPFLHGGRYLNPMAARAAADVVAAHGGT